MNSSRILSLSVALATSFSLLAFSPKGLSPVRSFATPEQSFFGKLSFVLKTDKPWFCKLDRNTVIEILPENNKNTDIFHKPQVTYRLCRPNGDDTSTILSETTLESTGDVNTVTVYTSSLFGTTCYGNNGRPLFKNPNIEIPAIEKNEIVTVFARSEKNLVKYTEDFELYPERESYPVPDFSEYDNSSPVGLWHYLDRITPKNGSVLLGGKFSIAIIEDPNGSDDLLILYIAGSRNANNFWSPGKLKGRLYATSFEGVYDLEWYDDSGYETGMGENSVSYEGTNLLTLDFPLLGSQIRFQR